MRLILSFSLLFTTCVIIGMRLYISVNPCSNLFACSFSSLVLSFTCSTTNFKASLLFFVWRNSIASFLARDCTYCVTLTWSFYSSLVGILSSTNSTCTRSFSCVWSIPFPICSMSNVIWKFVLTHAMVWMVSCSLSMVLASTYVVVGNGYVPPSGLSVACIHSKNCLILANSFWILPCLCWASSKSSASWYCTHSMMSSI